MGNLIDSEPNYNEGWGYCSSDEKNKNCNGYANIFSKDISGKRILKSLDQSQPVKIYLNKMYFPKLNTFQTFEVGKTV